MKNLLLFIGFVSLTGCNAYTVKNNSQVDVEAGDTIVKPGYCEGFSDSFFGLFGNYPITIGVKKDCPPSSDNCDELYKEQDYPAGHYVVNPDGSVVEVGEGCDPDDNPNEANQTKEGRTAEQQTKPEQDNAQDADTTAKQEKTGNTDETAQKSKSNGEEI